MIAALQDIRNAYDARDRDALERALERIEQALKYTGPTVKRELTPAEIVRIMQRTPGDVTFVPKP